MEIGGILFCALYTFFAERLYELSGKGLVGVLFGSVNDSPWENIKPLLLAYLLWGIIETLSLQPPLHRFAVAKTASLYLLGGLLLLGAFILNVCDTPTYSFAFFAMRLIALCTSVAVSMLIYNSNIDYNFFFAPCVFLLFLFLACYFSLTPFPLKNILFMDSKTGLYGLIPYYYDIGAFCMT